MVKERHARYAISLSSSMFMAMILGACGDSGYGPGHAKVSLLSEKRTATSGAGILLGVRFDLEPGWHLYWKGQNETGYPPHVTLELPEGFRAGEIIWPVPRRLVSPGNILDHVYEGQVVLLVPITIPAETKPGRYPIKGEASWLACHEACVPGKQGLELSLSVGDAEIAHSNKVIDDTKASLPRTWAETARVQHIETSWQNRLLIIKRPGASRMLFFPDTTSAPINDLVHAGDVPGDEIRLATQDSSGQISGILGIETPQDTIYCSFDQTLPEKP